MRSFAIRSLSDSFRDFLIFMKYFTRGERFGLVLLVFGGLFNAILEFAAAFSIFPILRLLYQPQIVTTNSLLKRLYDYLGYESPKYVVCAVIFSLLGIMVVKGFYSLWYLSFQWNYLAKIRIKLQKRIFSGYLSLSYEDYLKLTSSRMVSMFTSTVDTVVNNFVYQYINIFNQLLVAFALVVMLFVIYSHLALWVIGISFLILYSHSALIKYRMKKIGDLIQSYGSAQNQVLNQSFKGFKDTKIHQKEDYFTHEYNRTNEVLTENQHKLTYYRNLPAVSIEIIGLVLIYISLILLIISTDNLPDIFARFGVFAFLCLRAIPIVNRSVTSVVLINSSKSAISKLLQEAHLLNLYTKVQDESSASKDKNNTNKATDKSAINLSFKDSIQLRNVSYLYPASKETVLENISLSVRRGEFIGITGKSGSGKTTLIGVLLGFLKPTNGQIILDGKEINSEELSSLYALIGYVDQQIFLLEGTIAENVAYGVEKNKIDYARVETALKKAMLWGHVNTLEKGMQAQIGENGLKLSGGQRQRLSIARALYRDVKILILDEASATLDSETEKQFFDIIYSLKSDLTVIMIAHRLSTLKNCDKIIFMEQGQIIGDDTLESLYEDNPKFQSLVDYSNVKVKAS